MPPRGPPGLLWGPAYELTWALCYGGVCECVGGGEGRTHGHSALDYMCEFFTIIILDYLSTGGSGT